MTAPAATRASSILIRVTRDERNRLTAEARRRGLALGAWLRSLGLASVREDGDYAHDASEADAAERNGEDPEIVAGMRRRAEIRRDERAERRRVAR